MVEKSPFCNSDKYSFVIAFQQVIERIPENLREMLDRGEASMGGDLPEEEIQASAFIRRAYLMDLYRFYRLYPSRHEFQNPFDVSRHELGTCEFFSAWLFKGSPLEPYKDKIVRLLKRQKLERSALNLLDSYSEDHRNVQYYIWSGMYEKALELEPHNEKALQGNARELFDAGLYEEAAEVYDDLLLLHPEKTNYLLNKSVCLVNLKDYEEALKLLYKLNYENPEDDRVNRVLAWTHLCSGNIEQAWTHLCSGNIEQADKIYKKLMGVEKPLAEDLQNYGYCCWFIGKVDEAADCFRKYQSLLGPKDSLLSLFDTAFLKERGISDTQIKLMEALVSS